MVSSDRLDPDLVQDLVNKAHSDFARVRALLEGEPALVNAAWDWGAGDWETGLGAAAHMGRRDIALYLLERARVWTSSRRQCLGTWTSCARQSPRFRRRGHGKARTGFRC